jgi:peptidoglycan L-alanyl-D-glutamate endopeptidase CwlK
LHPLFQPKARDFVEAAKAAGLDVLIYCTYRNREEQDELYTHGRTAPGKIVTNARAGQSAHNFGLAFDGVPLIAGKPAWDDHEAWETYGHVASAVGLEWAGNWPRFKEFPHIQFPNWKSVAGVT